MAEYLLKGLGISLGLTLLFEILYAMVLGIRGKKLLPVLLVNVLTNPPVVLLALTVITNIYGRIAMEFAVIAIEGYIYHCFGRTKDYVISKPYLKAALLNVFSYGMGAIVGIFINMRVEL